MTEKISGFAATDPVAPVKSSTGKQPVAERQNEGGAAKAAAPHSADQVTLTSSARSMQKLEEAVAKAPIVNAAKVAEVKRSVGSGTYKVDSGRVADKMIKFEKGLK